MREPTASGIVVEVGPTQRHHSQLSQQTHFSRLHGRRAVGICPGDCNGRTGTILGPGCAAPYSAALNGGRNFHGPSYEVNAYTGFFNYPYDDSAPIEKKGVVPPRPPTPG